jgi:uncharacterized protein YndB with AHSA1/START domain
MKIVKKILMAIVILIAILLVAALFVKKEYSVEREVTINKPKEEVFNYVKFQKNQDNYNKWVMVDPNLKKDYRGADGTVGFVYAWNGNSKAGKGEQEIKKITEGERIDCELRFKKPFEGIAYTRLTTETVSENQTKVKWGMEGKNPYPLNLMNIFIPNMLGKDLQTSLSTLKIVLEK